MTALQHLRTYIEGWRLGDPTMSLYVLSKNFFYDDPNSERISRERFAQFVEDFKQAGRDINNGVLPAPFLTYTDLVIDEDSKPARAWCWWQVTGTPLQGSAIVKFDDSGILSERIAYFTKLPD